MGMANTAGSDSHLRQWALSTTRTISFAEERGARIVGITANRSNVGVTLLSNELARAYNRLGLRATIIDASRVDTAALTGDPDQASPTDLNALVIAIAENISIIDLAKHPGLLNENNDTLQRLFDLAATNNTAVVIDLPPVISTGGNAAYVLRRMGSVCKIVYLLCMSGAITESELLECLETCKIFSVPVQGIIINDFKEMASSLATGW